MPLENIEAIHIQIIIQTLIKSQNSCRISQHEKVAIHILLCRS